jgi:YHS domain-containing protein/uncharacterized membrane protein YraQ (UPF0718 family)
VSTILAAIPVLSPIARGLREGFFMFWETLWALVLGFTLSGVVQAFISKDKLQAKLGDRRPRSILRASGYGMASSSCSYAASAMSKSLFSKGADFVTSMVFMIASTNLVVELGLVMLVLLGWQFMAAEFVGGPIMITIIALLGGVVFTKSLVEKARKKLNQPAAGEHDHMAMTGVSEARQAELEATSWANKVRSPAAWSDASSYAVADVTMLRKELVIGYTIAGLLAALVSNHVWNSLFLHGHGFWTSLENVLVGPLIAVISWVCSIGNVPLAAALWSGGISFGGVIAFIFADLIAMPLILIYRKFYGNRLTFRVVALFYVAMATAGLITEGIFALFGAIPTHRSITVARAHFEWNYTTYLNIMFIGVAALVWWLARNRARFGGGTGYAIDPVCGMQVRTADAPATTHFEGSMLYFCADRCRERFLASPQRFIGPEAASMPMETDANASLNVVDPVCGMSVDSEHAAGSSTFDGVTYYFCATSCRERFDAEPTRFTGDVSAFETMSPSGPVAVSLTMKREASPVASAIDPICGMSVDPQHAAAHRITESREFWFCSMGCADTFDRQ